MVRRLLISLFVFLGLATAAAAQSSTVPGSQAHSANKSFNVLRVQKEILTTGIKCSLTTTCPLDGNWTISASTLSTTGLNGPLIANGSSPLSTGTFSGNTTTIATMSAVAITPGHYLTLDASGNIADGGSPCCTSGSVGTGTTGQIAYYAANGTAVVGASTISLTGLINANAGFQISSTNVLRANFNNSLHPNIFVGSGGNTTLTGYGNYGLTNGLTNLTGGGLNTCVGDGTCGSAANLTQATAVGAGALATAADSATYAIGVGPGACGNVSGSEVICIGHGAGTNISGTLVAAFGSFACAGVTTGGSNYCFGYNVMGTGPVTGSSNFGAGDSALQRLTSGSGNIAFFSLANLTTGSHNIALFGGTTLVAGNYNVIAGAGAFFFGDGSQNVILGGIAGPGISGSLGISNSTIVGYDAAQNVSSSSPTTNIVALGAASCNDITTATGSICIGTGVSAGSSTQNSLLNIGNLIRGDMANSLLRTPGMLQVGGSAFATASPGELALAKETDSGTAPGAGFLKFEVLAGTTPGSCKIIVRAGTSTAATTLADNVGGAC